MPSILARAIKDIADIFNTPKVMLMSLPYAIPYMDCASATNMIKPKSN